MLYAFICQDHPNSLQQRLQARPEHLARLQSLKEQGRLIIAGPHPAIDSEDPGQAGFSGSLIVADFENLATAEQWAAEDPYQKVGVYKKVSVKPFKKVLP
ncbi:hypothetical protein A9R01_16930 ['Osedax' symbiont bacterium Rs2_46_30_T18]|nr:hypothetical protein A9R01_16930 ['Osedax' symbiont bacterium Rs2_46_30_T18]